MKSHRLLATAAVLALAVTPVALAKQGGDNPGKGHAKSELKGQNGKGHAKGKHVVVKGVVTDVSATTLGVDVPVSKGKGNKKPSGAISFPLSADTKLTVDAGGIQVGDKVVVQATVKDGVYTVRHVVDQTHPPVGDDDDADTDEQDDAAPAPAPAS